MELIPNLADGVGLLNMFEDGLRVEAIPLMGLQKVVPPFGWLYVGTFMFCFESEARLEAANCI